MSNLTEQLQNKLMSIIKEMIINDIPLPDNFVLYYLITEHNDRQGITVNIDPYLTKNQAERNLLSKFYEEGEGNPWWYNRYQTVLRTNESTTSGLSNYDTTTGYQINSNSF